MQTIDLVKKIVEALEDKKGGGYHSSRHRRRFLL